MHTTICHHFPALLTQMRAIDEVREKASDYELSAHLTACLALFLFKLGSRNQCASRVSLQIWRLLADAKLDKLCELFKRFFSSIPNDWYRNNKLEQYEGYYASLFYSQMVACGATTIPEDVTATGGLI